MTNTVNTIATLSASALHDALKGDAEIALLDSRDEAIYDTGHLLMASCVPLSRLELMLPPLVPKAGTRIVWYDNGDGTAERAAERAQTLGYTNITVLDGGLAAWRDAGFMIYEGVHVPSKAFAEVIEHERGTPSISVEEFNAMTASGADVKLFDTRTVHEYLTDGLPGAFSTPGPEILQHFSDLVTSEHTTVVVHCGGRTRSIIGAQTLIDADVPNKVVSLRNGTQGWRLAGLDVLQRSPDEAPGEPSAEAVAYAIDATKAMAARNGIAVAPYDPNAASLAPMPERTVYTIDVRSQTEYEAGHVPGFKNVAAGQLVQETDRHLGVWNAHAVLLDDNGVRAICAANFLQQMGWSVEVMTLDDGMPSERETGPTPVLDLPASLTVAPSVDAPHLNDMLQTGNTRVIDVDWSREFFAGHIPGAYWCLRNQAAEHLADLPPFEHIVFTSSDGRLAALAATELSTTDHISDALYLAGGTQAWRGAGYPIETGAERMLCPAQDVRMRAREQAPDEREAKMQAYLAWELALAEQLADDPLCRYQLHNDEP